jgi:hypothetical protein
MCRMNDNLIPKMVYEWELEWRRCGLQPKSMKQCIHQTMGNPDIRKEGA